MSPAAHSVRKEGRVLKELEQEAKALQEKLDLTQAPSAIQP